jgi:hypothetical protein
MKRLIFTLIICTFASAVFAQADSSKVKTDTVKKTKARVAFSQDGATFDAKYKRDTSRHASKAPGFSWAITFSRFDLGLTTMIDNGSTTLSPQNQFLRYRSWKSSNVGFDVIDFKYRFTSSFRIYLAAGFDWTLFRLRDNITILENQPVLTYKQDNVDFSKNRFSSSYLRLPLSFEFRTKDNSNGNNWHFVFGPEGGILLGGLVKQISPEFGKQKYYNNYHFTRFRYGPFLRVGEGAFGIFAKYYMNDMFEDSPEQKGLKNFAFGFTYGF